MPRYMISRMTPQHLLADVARGMYYYKYEEAGQAEGTFLQQMIESGKALLYTDMLLPDVEDTLKIGYSAHELAWVESNEKEMWAYLTSKDLLFSTNQLEIQRFIGEGPQTFAPDFRPGGPARIAQWVGWQIMRSYAEAHTNDEVITALGSNDYERILRESKYRGK